MASTANVTVLLPGKINPRVVERLEREFDLVRIAEGDPALIPQGTAERVRAIAVHGPVRAALVDALPKLEIVSSFGVGYDPVDVPHCIGCGVMVTHTPDVLTEEVADTVLGLLINTVRELPKAEIYLRAGRWVSEGEYPPTRSTLRGRHAGIFGMGRIGLAIARRLEAMRLKVSYHNRRPVEAATQEYHPTLLSLARAVDTLICVAPGGPSTAHAVNAEVLDALGPDGILISAGRGSSVDEPALIEALRQGRLRAAGMDVFASEPNFNPALLDLPNLTMQPHLGSATQHTRNAMSDLVVDNLVSWFTTGAPLTGVPEAAGLKRR